jgi:hypothetical protein
MAAPTNAANVKKVLANSEPSTHGTKQIPEPLINVRFRGKNEPIASQWGRRPLLGNEFLGFNDGSVRLAA